ncbi:hypothetical protein FB451DRAFT_1324718 [Mycena latifolia]|nr:hypothetical protein FB451DRAFT_1324718 [Mycena latifolia]
MRNWHHCHRRGNSAQHARHHLHEKSRRCAQSRCARPQKPPENQKRNMLHPCYIYGTYTYMSLPTSCTMCTMFTKSLMGPPTSASSPSSSSSSKSLSFACAASICTSALGDGWRMRHLYGQPVTPCSMRSFPKYTMWSASMFSCSTGNAPAGARTTNG